MGWVSGIGAKLAAWRGAVEEAIGFPWLAAQAWADGPDAARAAALLLARRAALKEAGRELDAAAVPPGAMGLALSGGGIRSATIALGLVQALARRGRLLDFDYLSTVSGGGYLGSFLTSLYVPNDGRGLASAPDRGRESLAKVHDFVDEVLALDARRELLPDPFPGEGGAEPRATAGDGTPMLRNPIWWLREHGRYLAPNGPTDYAFAISYLARNWLAMLYTFGVAAASFFFAFLAAEYWWPWPSAGVAALLTPARAGIQLSPLTVFAPVLLALSLASALAYWLTVSLRTGDTWQADSADPAPRLPPTVQFALRYLLIFAATLAVAAITAAQVGVLPTAGVAADAGRLAWLGTALRATAAAVAPFWRAPWPWWPAALGVMLSLVALAIGGALGVVTAWSRSGDAFTNELRRRFTLVGAVLNQAALAVLVLAAIDTLAIYLATPPWHGAAHLYTVALAPAAAWLIAKLPQWLGGGRLEKLVGEHLATLALILGVLLFAAVALVADVGVHAAVWSGAPWASGSEVVAQRFWPLCAIIVALFALTGSFSGFINLSSLHNLYSGRLTRAYMGASNRARLRAAACPDGAPITENHPKDYIDIATYQAAITGAPFHLVNVTLNETRNERRSQLVDRDRKGVSMVFAHDGLWVDAARAETPRFSWDQVRAQEVEALSVGQLCAISGAAASSGMGARTTLGGALAFTFANIRLGYWWDVKWLLPEARRLAWEWRRRIRAWVSAPWRTYSYLWNEMTTTYSRANRRIYLSDGGHFENSGAYELLRRGVRLALVADHGADPGFAFEDLENLVRKARIDLGLSINVAAPEAVETLFGADGAKLFLNGGGRDWRKVARTAGGSAFALLLDVYRAAPRLDENGHMPHALVGRIIWLKPRLFTGLPPDVIGYGALHTPFPQQTTGDQFFDEAQWESYRALGFAMGEALLTLTKLKRDACRGAQPGIPRPTTPPGEIVVRK